PLWLDGAPGTQRADTKRRLPKMRINIGFVLSLESSFKRFLGFLGMIKVAAPRIVEPSPLAERGTSRGAYLCLFACFLPNSRAASNGCEAICTRTRRAETAARHPKRSSPGTSNWAMTFSRYP